MPHIGEKDKGASGASTYKNMTEWEQSRIFRSTLAGGGSSIRPLLDTIQDGSIYRKPVEITADGGVSAKTVDWDMNIFSVIPDADPERTSVDGSLNINSAGGTTWAGLRDASTASGATDSGAADGAVVTSHADADKWTQIIRGVMLFDTSDIPDGAKIFSAEVVVIASAAATAEFGGDVVLCSSAPASNTSLVTGDFDSFGTTDFSDRLLVASFSGAGIARTFTLNDTGLAAIDTDGITKFGMRSSYDIDDDEPTWVASKTDTVAIASADNSAHDGPKLKVTYII